MRHGLLSLALVLIASACTSRGDPRPAPPAASGTADPEASAGAAASTGSAAAAAPPPRIVHREGQALARSPSEPALYLADEDHAALRRIAITPDLTEIPPLPDPKNNHDAPKVHFGDAVETHVDLPGRPAQLVATGDRVLVTVRDPGLLIVFSAGEAPKEIGRVAVPADAWGLAVSADASAAYVTSAWTHELTRVDLRAMRVAWTVDLAREPRGVTVTEDGKKVYVSHLVGADLTRVDVSGEPRVDRVRFPADPLRTLGGDKTVTASLGYAAILSPDGRRLFAARQALGALWAWQGNGTVDVLETAKDEPIAAERGGKPYGTLLADEVKQPSSWTDHAGAIAVEAGRFGQPRAMVYRARTRHLLVADEGLARLVELDAMSVGPGVVVNRFYRLGGLAPEEPTKIQIPPHCGAPTGIALSADESVAWVYCRSTDNLVAVRLTPDGARGVTSEIEYVEGGSYHKKLSPWGPFAYARLPVAAVAEPLALGRRLFYDATEPVVSEEMACSGCHPDGRDDGHVWRELPAEGLSAGRFVAGPSVTRATFVLDPSEKPQQIYGAARQTPMLAGRVAPVGPYGWHAESATLADRIKAGFSLHRAGSLATDGLTLRTRAEPLAAFLREGLVPPPRDAHEPTAQEEKGKEVFLSARAQCATCHVPKTDFTDRSALSLRGFKAARYFDEDPRREYKVPSLLYVGGTPPYYHDGSVATLDQLVDEDKDRMGHTSHLTAEERAALVAYLKTL